LDPAGFKISRAGRPLKLERIPMELLILLVDNDGQVVTREEIITCLWGKDVFLDTEHGINTAVRKIRKILRDDPDQPHFVQTVTGKGYRFIAPTRVVDGNNSGNGFGSGNGVSPNNGAAAIQVIASESNLPTALLPGVTSGNGKNRYFSLRRFKPEPWRGQRVLIAAALAGTIIAMLLVAGVAARRFWPRRSGGPQNLKIVPFTTYPGIEGTPSFSPDGNQIVFWWTGGEDSPGAPGLYIKQLGNERAVPLTEDPSCVVPAWSPDGRSIAFSRWKLNGSGIDSGIYLVPSLGGPSRKLATTQAGCDRFSHLSWSADGKWLAFPDFDAKVDAPPNGGHLYLLNVDTQERRMLPHPSPTCQVSWVPAFSPDGKSLAFACMTTNEIGGIFVEPATGGPAREIVQIEGNIQDIAWASDSQSLVYSLDGSLWRVPASGGIPDQLPRAQHASGLDIARNGERLAYSQVELRQNIWRLNLMSPTKASSGPTKLIASTGLQSGPRISPDGRHIAFESTRSGSMEIWLCDSDGSNPVQMTFFKTPLTGSVRWSPDSRHLVFNARATGHPQLYVLNADGGPPRLLLTGTPDAADPFWSTDGRWIYFASGQPAIWKVPADGGNAVRLTDTDGFNPQESADGARIYFVRGNDRMDVWWVPTRGGSSERLEGMPALVSGDHWTPSKHGIYFIDGAADPATLNLFDPNNRHITRVAALSGRFWGWGPGLNVSSDGHTVLYGKGDGAAADIMLIEGFH